MPAEKTRADSIRDYLTGAGSDGGAQADPDLSLGDYRSSTEVHKYTVTLVNPIANITVDHVGAGAALGDGSLECLDANTLRWKDNGGTYGISAAVANGVTIIIEPDGDPGAFIRITRTSATDLVPGTATVQLTLEVGNAVGMDDVTTAEAAAGQGNYRAIISKNESTGNVLALTRWLDLLGTVAVSGTTQLGSSGSGTIETAGSFADWPDSGHVRIETSSNVLREVVYYSSRTDTVLTVPTAGRARLGSSSSAGAATDNCYPIPSVAIGYDLLGVDVAAGAIDVVVNEDTAPSPAVTFVTGIRAADGIVAATLATTNQIGMWIWADTVAGAGSLADLQTLIVSQFEAA